ncbi:MAG: iron-sulfur cluster repair protein YtfE [Cellvibrio sp.]|nr:iron-sulfur cluster repair protein YtfE [Cellvibrio sp.]
MDLLDRSLGQLARKIPGATAVFHQYGLDFCCGGNKSLRIAASEKNVDANEVYQSLSSLLINESSSPATEAMPLPELIDYILDTFHAVHRQELPELIRLADKVERVHGDKPNCPLGLTAHLMHMAQELESHMQKEEMILFPMIKQGAGSMVMGPVSVMRHEHDDHGAALAELERLTNNIQPPQGACNTWRALYLGLQKLRHDLMEHIHLENNLLFAKVEEQFAKPSSPEKTGVCCGSCGGH